MPQLVPPSQRHATGRSGGGRLDSVGHPKCCPSGRHRRSCVHPSSCRRSLLLQHSEIARVNAWHALLRAVRRRGQRVPRRGGVRRRRRGGLPHVTSLGLCLLRQMRLCLRFLLLLRSRRPLRLLRLRPLLLRLLLLPPLLLLLLSPRLLSLVLLSLVLLLLPLLPVLHRVRRWHFVPPPSSCAARSSIFPTCACWCSWFASACRLAASRACTTRSAGTGGRTAPRRSSASLPAAPARAASSGCWGCCCACGALSAAPFGGCIRRRGRHDGAARRARLLAL